MQLWLLRPIENLPPGEDPWIPWYDKCFGFVVRAASEAEARQIADAEGFDENRGKHKAWLDAKYSTCVALTDTGDPGVIIIDVHSA